MYVIFDWIWVCVAYRKTNIYTVSQTNGLERDGMSLSCSYELVCTVKKNRKKNAEAYNIMHLNKTTEKNEGS